MSPTAVPAPARPPRVGPDPRVALQIARVLEAWATRYHARVDAHKLMALADILARDLVPRDARVEVAPPLASVTDARAARALLTERGGAVDSPPPLDPDLAISWFQDHGTRAASRVLKAQFDAWADGDRARYRAAFLRAQWRETFGETVPAPIDAALESLITDPMVGGRTGLLPAIVRHTARERGRATRADRVRFFLKCCANARQNQLYGTLRKYLRADAKKGTR